MTGPRSPAMNRLDTAGLALLLAALVLSGCASRTTQEDCQEVREYQASGSIPPFRVPEGMAQPPAPQRFAIPEAGAEPDPARLQATAGCLERPPDFFGRPVGTAPAPSSPGLPEPQP